MTPGSSGRSLSLTNVQNRVAGLRQLHSPAMNGHPCRVCLVADGYAMCSTRHTLDDIAVILNDLIESARTLVSDD